MHGRRMLGVTLGTAMASASLVQAQSPAALSDTDDLVTHTSGLPRLPSNMTPDRLTFVAAAMGGPSPLAKPLATLTATRRPTGTANLDIAFAWHITTSGGRDLVWHNGGTGGYRSFVGFDPAARIGVVVLSNAGTVVGVDDIGRHLLNRRLPGRTARSSRS